MGGSSVSANVNSFNYRVMKCEVPQGPILDVLKAILRVELHNLDFLKTVRLFSVLNANL